MRKQHNAIVLFFIDGSVPSAKDKSAFDKIICGRKSFRNAKFVDSSSAIEDCDAVEGAVPKSYSGKPSVSEFLKSLEKASSEDDAPIVDDGKKATGNPVWGSK